MKGGKIVYLTKDLWHNRNQAAKVIESITKELRNGGLAVLPTDTAYALAADATNEDAVRKVFALKQRDESKPLPIVVSDHYMIREYAELSPLAEHLCDAFMPGPFALVVPQKQTSNLAKSLSPKGIAFRIPENDFTRAVISDLGVPITSTSANLSGDAPLYNSQEVKELFTEKVQVILDAGNLPPTPPSTIVDLTGTEPKILRQGPVSEADVMEEIAEFNTQKTRLDQAT